MARVVLIGSDAATALCFRALGQEHELIEVTGGDRSQTADLFVFDLDISPDLVSELRKSVSSDAVLLIVARDQKLPEFVDLRSGAHNGLDVLTKPFDLCDLQSCVTALTADSLAHSHTAATAIHPLIEEAVYRRATNIVSLHKPLWLIGESGVGRRRLAQDLAERSGRSFETASANRFADGALCGGIDRTLLWVPEVEDLGYGDQERVADLIEDAQALVVVASHDDCHEPVAAQTFSRRLFFLLNGSAIHLPALRHRTAFVSELAGDILSKYARAVAMPSIELSTEAQELLQTYPWPGNFPEFEAVMLRSLLGLADNLGLNLGTDGQHDSGQSLVLEAQDLLFFDTKSLKSARETLAGAAENQANETAKAVVLAIDHRDERTSPADSESLSLDVLVAGLAHDFRNPLSVVKTFAQLQADSEHSSELGDLVGQACDKLDQDLVFLQDYCDLGTPDHETVELRSLIDLCDSPSPDSGDDQPGLKVTGALDGYIHCDYRYLGFIMKAIDYEATGTGRTCQALVSASAGRLKFAVQLGASDGSASRLASVIGSHDELPWRLALAADAARRSGGRLWAEPLEAGSGDLVLTLELPMALEPGDEQTHRAAVVPIGRRR